MYIIEIPTNVNKLNYVNNFLKSLENEFNDYTFINCTSSPINEYSYFEHNGMYYRNIKNENNLLINEVNYIQSYQKDNLINLGISFENYIEMNVLFELEKIMIFSKIDREMGELTPCVTILICPDGFNELHFFGQDALLTKMIMYLKNMQISILRR